MAAVVSSATLATIRARIRDQVENAWGSPDPLPLKTSSETLTTLRARVSLHLQDSAYSTWTTTEVDEAIEKALEEYNRHSPVLKIGTHTVTTAGREQDISGSITDIIRAVKVWCPYDSSDPAWPPNWIQFDMLPGEILSINEPNEPEVDDVIRIWYTTAATLNGLNGASTTIPEDDITYVINGAVHYAAHNKAATHLGITPAGAPAAPLATASAETLTTLRDRVETLLQDSTNATWATSDIDEAIEKAIEEFSRTSPQLLINDFAVSSGGREQDISAITGLLEVKAVWFPYTAASLEYPPSFVGWKLYPGSILYVDAPTAPTATEHIRIWYTKAHTLSGLNAAGATTIPQEQITYIMNGAAAYCALERQAEIAEDLTVDDETVARIHHWGEQQQARFDASLASLVPENQEANTTTARALMEWANEAGKAFRYGIRKAEPAWQRYAYGFRNDDIDEAIRWALGRFNEIAPQETIGTVTISSAGREQSLASLTDLLRVTRVWWPYDSSDPSYEPNWVPFEQWGTTLFMKSGTQPAAAEVIRVWYERLCAIKDLDSAAGTTLPADAETLLVTGAVGYVTEERIMEEPATRWRIPRALKEWGLARLRDFDNGLQAYAHREAAGHAGIHELPAWDRWEGNNSW